MNLAQKTRHCSEVSLFLDTGITDTGCPALSLCFAEREARPFRVCIDVPLFMPKSVETSSGVFALPTPRG